MARSDSAPREARPGSARDRIARRIRDTPVTGDAAAMRRAFAALFPEPPPGEALTLGGVACVAHGHGPPVVWLHGGGYVFGGPESHGAAAAALARRAGRRVIVPRYRRAPEAVWPAPRDDALAVLDAVGAPVPLVGDSAGGHLALAVARRRPGRVWALALISPNADRTGLSTTRRANSGTDLMNADEDDARLAALAMPDLDPASPDASPVLADLSGLPPVFLTASTAEVLLDDALLLARALARAGVGVQADIVPGLWHLWPLWAGELPQADRTLDRIAGFVRMAR